jgi:hypothetical protein
MRALFKILSLFRTARATSRGKLPQRLVRMRLYRAINRHIR